MFFHGLRAEVSPDVLLLSLLFLYGKGTKGFTLRGKEWDCKTDSVDAIMKKGKVSEADGSAACSGHGLCFPFSGTFSAAEPVHCGLWEEWYSAFVRKGADFPGMLCVPDTFTNW